ncbi:MAG: ABC-ATPase domain-containing protein, partial [Clostridia bacterium]|nr:ABC-ATPase domain-containing protein [Clostridia bacterium]
AVDELARGRRGAGRSGLVVVDRPGPVVLERTACRVGADGDVEARFGVGLPAAGRTVLGRQAAAVLCREVPAIVRRALRFPPADAVEAARLADLLEDQVYLRERLPALGLVAFVGDGAVLPRESGVSDRPRRGPGVVPFRAPASLAVDVALPHAGRLRGLGVPRGVTLVVGGGYHGKTTLLRALERGVYDHVAGDGREWVVTVAGAVKVRAEDGRRVTGVDISPFVRDLPQGIDTRSFSTESASGSTSQAANIIEALEAGATCLLLDEDTSATNFLVRDRRMQELVPREKEPITPFVDRVRQLYEERGVSTVMVCGGSGDYLDVADTVVLMDAYRAVDVTRAAREVVARLPANRLQEAGPLGAVAPDRIPLPEGLDARRGDRERVRAHGLDEIAFGTVDIDLSAVEQFVEDGQVRAVARALRYAARRYVDGRRTLREILAAVEADLEREGLDLLALFPGERPHDLARPRSLELAAALNRLRTLRVATQH